jgi:hypothetical protein
MTANTTNPPLHDEFENIAFTSLTRQDQIDIGHALVKKANEISLTDPALGSELLSDIYASGKLVEPK